MKDAVDWALNIADLRGATYADARVVDSRARALTTKNGKVGHASDAESLGIGIRAIAEGAWGLRRLRRHEPQGRRANGRASSRDCESLVARQTPRYPPRIEKPATADWATPIEIDPFTTSIEQNLDLLMKIDSELRAVPGITLAEANMNFQREESCFGSSEGANIHQTKYSTGTGYTAYAFAGTEIQKRSYPNSFGGQWQNKGYELIDEWKLVENARRIAEETVALHKADQCPEGVYTIILDSSQLGLQIHESIGHPIELDRVLGMEANFAGTSFLTLDKLRTLQYGSDLVNAVADATPEHGPGLGTFAFDDEGVPAQSCADHPNGLFTGYLSSRETAHTIGEPRSGGMVRAENWNRLPMIRMTNVSVLPGEKAVHPRRTHPLPIMAFSCRPINPGQSTISATTSSSGAKLGGKSKKASASGCSRTHRTQASRQNSGTPWTRSAHAMSGLSGEHPTAAKASRSKSWEQAMARAQRVSEISKWGRRKRKVNSKSVADNCRDGL